MCIRDRFRRLNQEGVTIVMITHEREIAEHANRIIMIRDGKIVDEIRRDENNE